MSEENTELNEAIELLRKAGKLPDNYEEEKVIEEVAEEVEEIIEEEPKPEPEPEPEVVEEEIVEEKTVEEVPDRVVLTRVQKKRLGLI